MVPTSPMTAAISVPSVGSIQALKDRIHGVEQRKNRLPGGYRAVRCQALAGEHLPLWRHHERLGAKLAALAVHLQECLEAPLNSLSHNGQILHQHSLRNRNIKAATSLVAKTPRGR